MLKKITAFSFVILIQLSGSSFAQSVLGLNYPMGIPVGHGSTISQSLGGAGVGIENDFLGASNNPANLGSTHRTIFSTAVASELLIIKDNSERSYHLNAALSTLSLSIPVSKYGTLGFSIDPLSNPAVRFRRSATFDEARLLFISNDASFFSEDSVHAGILRTGNALSWQVAWGYDLFKKARIGVAVKRLNFNQNTAKLLNTSGNITSQLLDSSSISYHTNAIVGGIIVPLNRFTIGISGDYYLISEATATRTIAGTRYTDTISDTLKYDLKPAPSITAGISYQINPQWFTAADIGMRLWSRFYDESTATKNYDNALTVSAGVQFIPSPNLLTPKLFEITQYRAGIRYAQLPGAQGSERALTLAAGLPMQTNGGIIDIIVELAQRSDNRIDKYTENMVGIKLGINAGRKWYQSGKQSY